MENYGFDEIRKIAFFGLAFGQSFAEADHESSMLKKASAFLSCIDDAIALISIDRKLLAEEWKDFSQAERTQLCEECALEFKLDDKDLEQRIEASISGGLKILGGVAEVIAAWTGKA